MDRGVALFLAGVTASMLVIPTVNLLSGDGVGDANWKSTSFLYNLDFAKGAVAGVLSGAGISIDPNQVIVGHDDWLFLGDAYARTVTEERRMATAADIAFGRQVGAAISAWDVFLADRGVQVFKVMVGPNKSTIYPEYLPDWMKPSPPTVLDAFLSEAGSTFIDMRPSILQAKDTYSEPLYYRTDTHWNYLGAAVAFRKFATEVAPEAPDLVWPEDGMLAPTGLEKTSGGDLTAFLHRKEATTDIAPRPGVFDAPVTTTRTDWETGDVLFAGPNEAVAMSSRPILVHADGALNQRKVLWLRDSFGNALSPYMAATFSDVMQVHWSAGLAPGVLDDLVERWKPDYVFVTVVEREAQNDLFAAFPPVAGLGAARPFSPAFSTLPAGSLFITPVGAGGDLVVSGIDPQMTFAVPENISPGSAQYLLIDLACQDDAGEVPLQLFWSTRDAPAFDEARSVKFAYDPRHPYFSLQRIGLTGFLAELHQIRLDIDRPGACTHFRLSPPVFGTVGPVPED